MRYQHSEPFWGRVWSHAPMERLQCRSSDESMHLVTWLGLARSLVCQYSVKLPTRISDIPKEISRGSKAHKWWYPR